MNEKVLETEQKNLGFVQGLINNELSKLSSSIQKRRDEIKSMLEYISSNNLDAGELKQAYAYINKNDKSASELENEKSFFQKVLPKPFFARICFSQDSIKRDFYVGLKGVKKDNFPYVIDWRTPVASLLYFSSLGKTSYIAPIGKIEVDLTLKRQFRLKPNKIEYYVDTNTKIDDNFLQEILSQNTSSYMHNIVQTIQSEQNEIIRKSPSQTVIIDGIAGSGKTSIAMHRISYILFCNRGEITSQNIMVISPNRLFSKYIGELLPELGEENVLACPITWVFGEIGLTPKEFASKLDMIEQQFSSEKRRKEIDIKYSIKFFDEVNDFLEKFDITPYITMALEKCNISIPKEIFASLNLKPSSDIKTRIENTLHMALVKNFPKILDKDLQKIQNKVLGYLKSLDTNTLISKLYEQKDFHYNEKMPAYEDVSIYCYLNYKLNGVKKNYYIKHIFVDEMQDYDCFSIYLLREIYPNAVMTLAGDFNQNLLSCQSNLEMLTRIFPTTKVDHLDISYRSTQEIIEFSQKIIDGNHNSHLVRHGEKPQVLNFKDDDEFVNFVNNLCEKYKNDKIAIITKTLSQAKQTKKMFSDFTLIEDEKNDSLLTSNKIITTTFLSKGLEYDRVIIKDASQSNYNTKLDKQNLYVACTRALHGLYVTYSGKLTNFIPI